MVGGQRLGVDDIKRRPDAAALDVRDERVGVDQRAAADVDDERPVGQCRQDGVVDDVIAATGAALTVQLD